jgi:hypothetical protein
MEEQSSRSGVPSADRGKEVAHATGILLRSNIMSSKDVAVFVGSLRKDSFNRKMANVMASLAPEGLRLGIVEIGGLALYNQDDDVPGKVPAAWQALRDRVKAAHAVLFVTRNTIAPFRACSRTPSMSFRGPTARARSTAGLAPWSAYRQARSAASAPTNTCGR